MRDPRDVPGFVAPVRQALTAPLLMGGAPRSYAILNGTLAAIVAFAWAIGSMLGLGETTFLIFVGIMAVPGLVLSFGLTRRILRVEHSLRDSGKF